MRRNGVLTAFAAVLSFAVGAHAGIITNPNFLPVSPYAYPGYGAVTGWTEGLSISGSNVSAQPFFNNGTLPSGDTTAGFLQVSTNNPVNSFSQTMSLQAGSSYQLSFVQNARDGFGLPFLQVLVGGIALDTPQLVNVVGGTNAFTPELFTFAATSASEVLQFVATPGAATDATALLSAVSVTVMPVPEPSSAAMLGMGVVGMLGFVRRRSSGKASRPACHAA